MSCLDATFTLTPRSPWYYAAENKQGALLCYGADFYAQTPYDFPSLYSNDEFFFDQYTAADPNIDYAQWNNRMRVPFLELYADLSGYGTSKQLALIFGFHAGWYDGRVLVYTDAGKISDQKLVQGDNQFLLELDVPGNQFYLYFIHAGGSWFFQGLSGYVV